MYSDSDDDSQLSQPHLFVKKTKLTKTTKSSEDVVDRERASLELISFSTTIGETDMKAHDGEPIASTSKPMNPTDKLLIKFSSNSSSESSNGSVSSGGETSLGELLDGDEQKLINKSQQTSPSLLGKLTLAKNLESIDWTELRKHASINSLESTVHSPEIASFQSKYLRNWQQQQRLYYDQKQSLDSLDTAFDSKLHLNYDQAKSTAAAAAAKRDDDLVSFKRKTYGIFNFDFDEELFYKVKKLFPQVTDEKIRTFMFKHHNQEHDVISAVINSLSPKRERRRLKHQSAMDKVLGNYIRMHRQIDQLDEERKRLMAKDEQDDGRNYAMVEIKIKYLKLLYPKADVLDLFYHLHNCEMKANNVAKKLEELGYERKSLSESEESLVSSLHFEELMPELKLNFGEQQNRITSLQADYPLIDIYLVKLALNSTRFNVNEARKLLDTVDVDQYKNLKTFEYDWSTDDSKFIRKTDRGTQTCVLNYAEYGQTYRVERKPKCCLTKCKSTWTKEDDMEKIEIKKIAKGPDRSNVKGPVKKERTKLQTPKGPNPTNCNNYKTYINGPNQTNAKGSDSRNLRDLTSSAYGPNAMNCKGSIKCRPERSIVDEPSDELLDTCFIKIDDLLPIGFSGFNCN